MLGLVPNDVTPPRALSLPFKEFTISQLLVDPTWLRSIVTQRPRGAPCSCERTSIERDHAKPSGDPEVDEVSLLAVEYDDVTLLRCNACSFFSASAGYALEYA
ncbi:uncharacterized protein L969DRAFT_45177 [Mixia osmundae IAM 14324]|uniref:Uncharacterized protein n=1 Tax=Mixia osmundae (strain CBS 9802 / IAM 14324 / JCM 22182 / KY 12970) TaxID=764103 RepID=G7DTV8_MIXOS|nr:uncharacterized protein L969DRAFT_45177 [Mixia osmundae IAM 14324]KEI41732.1 hypothetical protein L969DRAFT_45177 [Mixia osmundae IAM 14324]GAA94018.1 hypothetical protein E5Q_00665 [Mixia osmundae IAM 14324]